MKVFQRLTVIAAVFLCVFIVSDAQEAVSELCVFLSCINSFLILPRTEFLSSSK